MHHVTTGLATALTGGHYAAPGLCAGDGVLLRHALPLLEEAGGDGHGDGVLCFPAWTSDGNWHGSACHGRLIA